MKKLKNFSHSLWRQLIPYLIITATIFSLAYFGSLEKTARTESTLNMATIASNDYAASVDQISEFFIVSELASSMRLPTAEAVNLNYNSLAVIRSAGQGSTDKIEKPSLINTAHLTRGVVVHQVQEGDTLASLATKYRLTETQIRWSNQLKNNNLSVGSNLYLPSTPGIIYKVKSGDTIESLATKYQSSIESITVVNDLETTNGLTTGAIIILPNGQLPEAERPEYVPPAPRIVTPAPIQGYINSRIYWTSSNPMPWGWCTWYAWARRSKMSDNYHLPGGLGNANTWDNSLYGRYRIDGQPQAGAIFQTDYGYYGHVGIVDSVNPDGTITISDMNGIAGWGRIGSRTIPQSEWRAYKYIHERL